MGGAASASAQGSLLAARGFHLDIRHCRAMLATLQQEQQQSLCLKQDPLEFHARLKPPCRLMLCSMRAGMTCFLACLAAGFWVMPEWHCILTSYMWPTMAESDFDS